MCLEFSLSENYFPTRNYLETKATIREIIFQLGIIYQETKAKIREIILHYFFLIKMLQIRFDSLSGSFQRL